VNTRTGGAPTAESPRFIQIDEDGYFKMDDLRVADAEAGREWLSHVQIDSRNRAVTKIGGESVLIEAFDEPFIALDFRPKDEQSWLVTMPYGHVEICSLDSLTLDEWDRFHGRTERGVPFVLNRSAQDSFFNLLDEFDDESIVFKNKRYETRSWLSENAAVNEHQFWTNIYRTEQPRWDLGEPSHALPKLVPQLKLQRSRVLVPGAGAGHDAAWFAAQGHLVTALDFSEEAIKRARQKYQHLPNLTFMHADIFQLPRSTDGAFDIVFEHTCYCAISPNRRNELIKVWRRALVENGHVMGVFFTMDKPVGPPYGGSEWELRSRLNKDFRPLYWTRLRDSRENRLGHELFVYAQKRSSL
jgi:hypothetical protein